MLNVTDINVNTSGEIKVQYGAEFRGFNLIKVGDQITLTFFFFLTCYSSHVMLDIVLCMLNTTTGPVCSTKYCSAIVLMNHMVHNIAIVSA